MRSVSRLSAERALTYGIFLVRAEDDDGAIGLLPAQLDPGGPTHTMSLSQSIPNHCVVLGIQRDESEIPEHADHRYRSEQPPGPSPGLMGCEFHRNPSVRNRVTPHNLASMPDTDHPGPSNEERKR
ncbi:hypothetical protein LCGC14_2561120 [marine sediment metagenome]|uniref:Uncharacterized protein n=1 Tax=marine sediment metagenome TaxID=412755 RepID=A0A0F9DD48_9ZZZZ